jgi:1-acyl-sn-glycerol-3-phosphate acyltransferase
MEPIIPPITISVPERAPGIGARILRWILSIIYRAGGWKAHGGPPADRRCVIIAVPHTSNWDFVYTMGLLDELGLRTNFMGKASLFRWPFGRVMRDMGGVLIDRARGGNYVEAMVAEFARRKEFMLIIAPEGTRSAVQQWRTGFYHIAMGAGVPIVCGMLDYATRTGGLGQAIMPTGDYAADMKKIFASYSKITGRHPERQITDFAIIMRDQ